MVPAFLLLIFIFFKLISDLFCSISGTSLKQNALQKEARFANRTQQIMFILFESNKTFVNAEVVKIGISRFTLTLHEFLVTKNLH